MKATTSILMAALMTCLPNINGQGEGQPPPAAAGKEGTVWLSSEDGKGGPRLYSMKFKGGLTTELKELWTGVFTNDNFIITKSVEQVVLPAFEIRNVSLSELARSIQFLSEGVLVVNVGERDSRRGNNWQVGANLSEKLSSVKMRAVAAPSLFADTNAVDRLLRSVHEAEDFRRRFSEEFGAGEAARRELPAQILPLREQRVFVVIGMDNGIAGIESLIQASEQAAAEAAKAARR
jgi:hypothetical protein